MSVKTEKQNLISKILNNDLYTTASGLYQRAMKALSNRMSRSELDAVEAIISHRNEHRMYDLEQERNEAVRKLAEAEAELKGLRQGGKIKASFTGQVYVPVALTREQADSIREHVDNQVSYRFGNGHFISGDYEKGGEYEDHDTQDEVLPGYAGWVARGYYARETGWSIGQIWGLIEVERPCPYCQKQFKGEYRCKQCEVECQKRLDAELAEVEANNS